MKKFKISAMLLFAAMLVFSACGGGGGSDDPDNPGDPTATLEINGNTYTYTLPGGTVFKAMLTPDIATTKTFSCNIDADNDYDEASDVANVPERFIMGETEVTYQLWKEVYDWATSIERGSEKYTFANAGTMGYGSSTTNQHPVTYINWRDMIVWCNALTEYYNANNGSETDIECVYTYSGAIIRDSRDSNETSCDNAVQCTTAKGLRLPTSVEWEYAARYIGTSVPSHANYVLKDGVYYSKGNSASGATVDYNNASATSAVAVYGVSSTAAVKSKGAAGANALGLYDMSGNVSERCFNWHPYFYLTRVLHGGSFYQNANDMQVGNVSGCDSYVEREHGGFRFCRSM